MTFSSMQAAAICLAVWIAWAVALGLVLNWLSLQLLFLLHKQMRLLRRKLANLEEATMSFGYGLPQRNAAPRPVAALPYVESHSAPASQASGKSDGEAKLTREASDQPDSLLPRFVADSVEEGSGPQANKNHNQQLHYLTAAYIHVLCQFIGIIPPMLAFVSVAIWLAARLPGAFESPDVDYHRFLVITIISASYACVISATIVLLSIAWRTYEPVLHFRGFVSSGESAQEPSKGTGVQRLLIRMSSGVRPASADAKGLAGAFSLSGSSAARRTPDSPKSFTALSAGHYKAQSECGSPRAARIDHGFAVRRFSQSIVLSEDPEDVEMVMEEIHTTLHSSPPQYNSYPTSLGVPPHSQRGSHPQPATVEVTG